MIKCISNKDKIISFFFLKILKSLYPSPDPRKVQLLICNGMDMKIKCIDSYLTE